MNSPEFIIDPTSSTGDNWRELANRAGNGLEVSLLWSKSADRVKVTVSDARAGDSFEIHVDGADALGVFHHPFAYAPHGAPPGPAPSA